MKKHQRKQKKLKLNKTKQKNLTIDNHSIGLHSAVYTKKTIHQKKTPIQRYFRCNIQFIIKN